MLHMIVALQICVLELCGSIVFNNFLYIIQFCVTLDATSVFWKTENFIPQMEYLREIVRVPLWGNHVIVSKSQVRGWNIEIPKKYIYKTNKQTKTKNKAKQGHN